MVTSAIVSFRSAEMNEREGVKKRLGVRGGAFHFSCSNGDNQKDWRWISGSFHHGWLVVVGERRRTISHNGRAEWIIKAKFIKRL